MDITKINHKEIFAVLATLRALNLENAVVEQIKDLLGKLYTHIGVKHRLPKGNYVQRGVLLDDESLDYFPTELQRISYHPKGSNTGRANFDGESVFYACVATDVIEGYNCTAMELLPWIDVGFYQHRIMVGNWILQEETEFVFIGGDSNLTYLSNAAKNRHEKLKEFVVGFKESALALYSIDKFLCEQFSKEVPKEKPWEYKISAAYASLLRENGEPGLLYPSVKSAGAGLNLILFKDTVDKRLIKFDKAIYGTYYGRDKEMINEYTMGCGAKDGKLIWYEVYERLPGPIKDYYTGRSDYNPACDVPTVDFDPENKGRLAKNQTNSVH